MDLSSPNEQRPHQGIVEALNQAKPQQGQYPRCREDDKDLGTEQAYSRHPAASEFEHGLDLALA